MQEHNWTRKGNGYTCSPDKTSPRMTSYYITDYICCGCSASMSDRLLEASGYVHQSVRIHCSLDAAWKHRGDCHDFIMIVEEVNAGS